MATFSQRIGLEPMEVPLQVDSMSDELRHSIWNVLHTFYDWGAWQSVAKLTAMHFIKMPIDSIADIEPNRAQRWLADIYRGLPWNKVYEYVEFLNKAHQGEHIVTRHGDVASGSEYRTTMNYVFEREHSAYRFVGETIAPISDKTEVEAIELAQTSAARSGLRGAEEHLRSSVRLLSQKPAPDLRNVVKEAISAVESVAKILAKDERATLDQALKALAGKTSMHPALQGGFSKIYGYTNDADGIRHAITEAPTVDFAEAKYMLVACSAFVYYLVQKGASAGLIEAR